tara:strand:+ start:209 stop:1063 length:855 start_codon:yes stop_codon:yes gene_type:complete
MIDNETRIKHYLGEFEYKDFPTEPSSDIFDVPFKLEEGIKSRSTYDADLNRLYQIKPDKLWVQCGDQPYKGKNKVLVKTRDSFDGESRGIITKLNTLRHWNAPLNQDWDWSYKNSNVIWRGADTGNDPQNNDRLTFIESFYKILDVGFSSWQQNKKFSPESYPNEYLKGQVDISDLLKFKYHPVIDGNDRSSSLNWVLISNCLPIMPKQRFHSWACEKFLEPGVHYVECKRDFSDFLDKVEWCKSNDQQAKEIAENGKRFMQMFLDLENEKIIERDLINYVVEN